MYTVGFEANNTDTIASFFRTACSYYTNVRTTQITSVPPGGDLVQRISNGDITQFIMKANHQYKLVVNGQYIGRSPTLSEVEYYYLNPNESISLQLPTLSCDDSIYWILYSVNDKLPVRMSDDAINLPPDANKTRQAIVKLVTKPENLDTDGKVKYDSYVGLYFPTSIDGKPYELLFDSTPNDTVYATRINQILFSWKYQENGDYDYVNSQIIFMNSSKPPKSDPIELTFEVVK